MLDLDGRDLTYLEQVHDLQYASEIRRELHRGFAQPAQGNDTARTA
jgi:hypothetical protein